MGFESTVVRRELFGLDRKLKAAENSLKSAQWGVDRAQLAVDEQTIQLEIAKEVLKKVQANYDAIVAQKLFEDEKT
jgi:hypothetical protein